MKKLGERKGKLEYEIKVGLTPLGVKFYRKRNPVLVSYERERGNQKTALSKEESGFLREEIIPKFSLEKMFVSKVEQELKKNKLKAREIDDKLGIVTKEWLQNIENNAQKKNKTEAELNPWWLSFRKIRSDETIITPWRVATMGRLSEMGVVDWVIVRETGVSEFSLSKPAEKAPEITTR